MSETFFFRLLDSPIASKGSDLLQQIVSQNQGELPDKTFSANPRDFSSIPGSPFAYWTSPKIRDLFQTMPRLEQEGRVARVGDHSGDQDRYLRLYWEVSPQPRGDNRDWLPYQKGGAYSPYYYDIHLVTDWDKERETYFDFHGRKGRTSEHPSNYEFFFRQGLTWPRRTNGFSVRILPSGCIFADKGPAIFINGNNPTQLMALLAVLNTTSFIQLLQLQLARTELAQSFEVGLIQQTPIPDLLPQHQYELANLALECHNLARIPSTFDETTHIFCLPLLIISPGKNLAERIQTALEHETSRQAQINTLRARIDARVAELYGIRDQGLKTDDQEVSSLVVDPSSLEEEHQSSTEDEDEGASVSDHHPSSLVSDLLMWCVGATFGRWDAGFALQPELLPALGEPFDPLPRYSPGRLVEQKDERRRTKDESSPVSVLRPSSFVSPDGILVDDPDHPRDIVTAVRRVLRLIWKEQADAIEQEACQILDVPDLRTFFRDPKLFFNFHIKRYSKSRRKAPIYWLLQSSKRNYAVWLYYPRLNPDLFFLAGREYVDAKIQLEETRLKELKTNLSGLSGTNLKAREKQIARQADLVEEVKAFGKELDRVALLELKPDLNDGVLLNIAPLHNLVPWKEAEKAWNELAAGKYGWSSIGEQMMEKKKKDERRGRTKDERRRTKEG